MEFRMPMKEGVLTCNVASAILTGTCGGFESRLAAATVDLRVNDVVMGHREITAVLQSRTASDVYDALRTIWRRT